jgi:hypothetical protein
MTRLLDLPQEVLDNVFRQCLHHDLKSCRLVSKALSYSVESHVYNEVHMCFHPKSIERLEKIASSRFRQYVQHFVLHSAILPRFCNFDGWVQGTRWYGFSGDKYDWEVRGQEYAAYVKEARIQESIVTQSKALRALSCLPKLRSARDIPCPSSYFCGVSDHGNLARFISQLRLEGQFLDAEELSSPPFFDNSPHLPDTMVFRSELLNDMESSRLLLDLCSQLETMGAHLHKLEFALRQAENRIGAMSTQGKTSTSACVIRTAALILSNELD